MELVLKLSYFDSQQNLSMETWTSSLPRDALLIKLCSYLLSIFMFCFDQICTNCNNAI